MLKRIFFTSFTFPLILGACATNPDKIAAAYVSPFKYRAYNCDQLAEEMDYIGQRTVQLYQRPKADGDADNWQMARLGCVSRPRTESKSRFNNLSVFEFMLKLGIDGNLTPLARSSQKQAGHLIKLSTLLRDSSNGPGCSGLNWPRCRVNDPSFLKIFFRANCFCRIHFIRPNICNVLPGNL